jgi:hypothetical protein
VVIIKAFLLTLLILLPLQIYSAEVQTYELNGNFYEYSRPTLKEPFIYVFPSFITFFERSFARENWTNLGIIAGATALLYRFDRQIFNESQRLGRRLGIGNAGYTKSMITYNHFDIFRGPTDFGSSLYFLGDGWTHTAIFSSFLVGGAICENNRAMQTGTEIFHGLIINTFSNQFLKRITGREDPMVATTERGRFKFFPNQKEYGKQVTRFDAFPSGHVATSMMTFTVIRNNYPEYNSFLAPLQWTWISLLSFQMMNNGVHWASDYPLAIGMGYLFGQIATEIGRKKLSTDAAKKEVYYLPIFNDDGAPGMSLVVSF